jgi:hypothetical protein
LGDGLADPHVAKWSLWALGENRVLATAHQIHTTNLLQALGLVFLGALKKLNSGTGREFDDVSVEDQVT